ncbi:MAG: WD40 repeat domain-containing serine/threonine protein kinase [Planctomycetota bacterium]|jgi:WD40 repeat protein/serine/threonine protein kinase
MDKRKPPAPDSGLKDSGGTPSHPGSGESDGIVQRIRAAHGLTSRSGRGGDEPHTDETVPRESDDIAATHSSRFVVGPEIARGGMGAILEVRDPDLRRSLAMKVLLGGSGPVREPGGSVAPEHLNRFLEEAQITAQLAHPGVIPVHELGMDADGRIFFTMNLVHGKTLSEIVALARARQDGWTNTRALQVILRVCETIAFAHNKGVIHRDLKPDNVMVGSFGETYVMDWGLAKVIGEDDSDDLRSREADAVMSKNVESVRGDPGEFDSPMMTMDGAVVGTPAYMSPEQASGAIADVDRRSDVYAIGALLYELLTGHPPHVNPDDPPSPVAVLLAVRAGPPTPILEVNRDAPQELVAVCEKAMARQPDARYPSAADLAEDIQAFIEGRVVRADRTGALIELRKWIQRNRGFAASIAVAVVALVGGLAVSIILTAEARQREEAASRQAYRASVSAAANEIANHNMAAARERLEALPKRLRGWEWRHLASRLNQSTSEVHAQQFAVSPDGRVLIAEAGGVVSTLDPLTGVTKRVRTSPGRNWKHFVPPEGGNLLISSVDGKYRIIDPGSGQGFATAAGYGQWGVPPLVVSTPDGSHAAWADEGTIHVFRRDSGQGVSWPDAGRVPLAISADGRFVAVGVPEQPGVEILQYEPRRRICLIDAHASMGGVDFSPDGSRLAIGGSLELRVFDARTGKPAEFVKAGGFDNVVREVVYSPDGTTLAAVASRTVHVLDARTGDLLQSLAGDSGVSRVAFSNDGRWLLAIYANDLLRAWDVGAGRAPHVLPGHESFVYAVSFLLDGHRIVSGGWDGFATKPGNIRIWDAATGEPVASWGAPDRIVESIAVAPDGGRIFACGRGLADNWATHELEIWDAETGERLPAPAGDLARVTLTVDGLVLAAAEVDVVRLFDATTLKPLASLRQSSRVESIAFRRDGKRVAAVTDDGALRVWALDGKRLVADEPIIDVPRRSDAAFGHGTKLRYSRDGTRLFRTSRTNHLVQVTDADNGSVVGSLRGHGAPVFDVIVAPESDRVFSGGDDKRVLIWEAGSLRQIVALSGHQSYVFALALSPDGQTLVSGSGDGTLRVWNSESARDRQQAIVEHRRLVSELEPRVRALFDGPDEAKSIVAKLRTSSGLSGRPLEIALQIALRYSVDRRLRTSKGR